MRRPEYLLRVSPFHPVPLPACIDSDNILLLMERKRGKAIFRGKPLRGEIQRSSELDECMIDKVKIARCCGNHALPPRIGLFPSRKRVLQRVQKEEEEASLVQGARWYAKVGKSVTNCS